MSTFIINEAAKGGFTDGRINDVTFLYVSIQSARDKYKSTDKEYSVKLVVDEDTGDAFENKFPKNPVKKVKTSNFEEQFGIAPPIPDAKNQFIITLKVADDKTIKVIDETGVETDQVVKLIYDEYKRPKVYVPATEGVEDITRSINVGNGSRGDASFWLLDAGDFGFFPKLSAILVTDLIAYEKSAGSKSAFGNVVNGASTGQAHFDNQEREEAPMIIDDQIPY